MGGGGVILKPLIPIVQPQGINIFNQCFHTDNEIYSPVLLLSTTMKNGEAGQNNTPKKKLLNSSKNVSRKEFIGFFLTRVGFHKPIPE